MCTSGAMIERFYYLTSIFHLWYERTLYNWIRHSWAWDESSCPWTLVPTDRGRDVYTICCNLEEGIFRLESFLVRTGIQYGKEFPSMQDGFEPATHFQTKTLTTKLHAWLQRTPKRNIIAAETKLCNISHASHKFDLHAFRLNSLLTLIVNLYLLAKLVHLALSGILLLPAKIILARINLYLYFSNIYFLNSF